MRRSTSIYILLFAAVFGAAVYFNSRPKTTSLDTAADTPAPVEYLFTVEDGLPTGIRIESKAGEVVDVARNAENTWVMTQPIEASADQGSVEAAATQVATMQILERVSELSPNIVGLDDHPEYTITLKFTSGVERIVEIGVLTPTASGYYARGEDGEIVILGESPLNALLGLLTNPPYAPTETPLPPTLEVGPVINETATPQP